MQSKNLNWFIENINYDDKKKDILKFRRKIRTSDTNNPTSNFELTVSILSISVLAPLKNLRLTNHIISFYFRMKKQKNSDLLK